MRLLRVDGPGPLALTKIEDGVTPPPYAILSHTWGPDEEEVTFNDLRQAREAKRKKGYQKLEFCKAQAQKDGLRYYWSDTCCIAKVRTAIWYRTCQDTRLTRRPGLFI
jgi:hypothetical protein